MQEQTQVTNVLFLTAHDFRTARWASVHFMAEQLAARGVVRFFSMRYSLLSKYRPDPRHGLKVEFNQVERSHNVDCYLWKTPVHPINLRRKFLKPMESLCFNLYLWAAPKVLKTWIAEADTVIIESGTGVIFFPLIKKINPKARVIYLCSDSLVSIDAAPYVTDKLREYSNLFDYIIVPSRKMEEEFAPGSKIYFVPQGIDKMLSQFSSVSPYGPGVHAVSVGSMLFDPSFFDIAGKAFPYITFHVIGSGSARPPSWPENVKHYDEMKFAETVRYLKHATFGIAPYFGPKVPASLADTSMKLMQYSYFGIPSVCPVQAVDRYTDRFGYVTGDAQSITQAVQAASVAGKSVSGPRPLNWEEVTDRIIDPTAYADTIIA